MRNAGLEDAQAEIKIARRNSNSFRYANNTTYMAEGEKEPKNLLMKVKEESQKAVLKLSIQKMKIMPLIQSVSVQPLSRVWLFVTPWIAACQASLSITNSRSSLRLTFIESVMPSSHLILCHPLLLLPSIFPSIRLFFQWVSSLHQVAKVLEFQLQHQSFQWTPRTDLFQNELVGSPCSPRDSQESSPTPQFKSINSLALSFLHRPTVTSIHDHWKNHSLD